MVARPVIPQSGPTCETWSRKAREITGTIVYSGALWVHPEARGWTSCRSPYATVAELRVSQMGHQIHRRIR